MREKAILISIDGMRPDGFLKCGHPFIKEMMEKFSYTLTGSSMEPPVTLPCHTSVFYSIPPARHGIFTNTYVPPVRPVPGLGEQLAAMGKKCGAFYNWEPMRHVWHSETMKYTSFINAYEEENTDLILTEQAIELIRRKEPDFVYLYMVETDEKGGHDHGWMTEEYLKRIENAVGCVEKIFRQASEKYHIIVMADHGGHERVHGVNCPEDMTIPLFFWGDSFKGGSVLENISLLDIAPTIAYLMGIPACREWEGKNVSIV